MPAFIFKSEGNNKLDSIIQWPKYIIYMYLFIFVAVILVIYAGMNLGREI